MRQIMSPTPPPPTPRSSLFYLPCTEKFHIAPEFIYMENGPWYSYSAIKNQFNILQNYKCLY